MFEDIRSWLNNLAIIFNRDYSNYKECFITSTFDFNFPHTYSISACQNDSSVSVSKRKRRMQIPRREHETSWEVHSTSLYAESDLGREETLCIRVGNPGQCVFKKWKFQILQLVCFSKLGSYFMPLQPSHGAHCT